jgi:NADH:ubiquinone oxidoreductase subunit E
MCKDLEVFISSHAGQPGSLITVLHKIQENLGFIPRELQVKVADTLGVPLSEVYGVITFYTFFSLKPKGKHSISICKGTACYVRGASKVLLGIEKELGIKPGDTTSDGNFSLDVVYCLGACGLGPVLTIGEEVHARLKPDKVPALLGKYKQE